MARPPLNDKTWPRAAKTAAGASGGPLAPARRRGEQAFAVPPKPTFYTSGSVGRRQERSAPFSSGEGARAGAAAPEAAAMAGSPEATASAVPPWMRVRRPRRPGWWQNPRTDHRKGGPEGDVRDSRVLRVLRTSTDRLSVITLRRSKRMRVLCRGACMYDDCGEHKEEQRVAERDTAEKEGQRLVLRQSLPFYRAPRTWRSSAYAVELRLQRESAASLLCAAATAQSKNWNLAVGLG